MADNENENNNPPPTEPTDAPSEGQPPAVDGPPAPPPPPVLPPLDDRTSAMNIEDEMKEAYIDYAMSVIIGRALPDVRDGLKPVHRRVLYAMYDQGFTHNKPFTKSARTVGEVLGKYHPHGDSAVYDTLVRMAQDFSLRYPLIDGHGNFGSVDGDEAAAMRYTESRLDRLAEELLRDIDQDTVEFMPNFDESLKEPTVLPSKFPNLMVNGSSGIAVGMATNIPPHNLSETIDALILMIDDPETDTQRILEVLPGPDFPTGGIIMGREGIRSYFETGRGSIVVRARTKVEEFGKGRDRIIINELPYQVNKAKLVIQIAELVKDKRIDGITDLRDESDREGMRVCIELRKGTNTEVILNQLFQHTPMQSSFGVQMLVLVDNRPRTLPIKMVLRHYLDHQVVIIKRRTQFQLTKAEEKAHILEGLTIALDNLDEVITLIREAESPVVAKEGLCSNFALSEKQAQAILEMRLQRLTGLEREKIVEEYHQTLALIQQLKAILGSEAKVYEIIRKELLEIKDKYGDERRSEISMSAAEALATEDLIQEEDILITVTQNGYIKRVTPTAFRQIARGGKGVGVGVKEDDVIEHLFHATTHTVLMVFTNAGKVHWIKGHKLPEGGRTATGRAIVNLLNLAEGERVTALLPVRKFDEQRAVFMATKRGVVKATPLAAFSRPMSKGIIAINLDEGDELVGVKTIKGDEHVVLATRKGQAIRFACSEVRVMGRAARGVTGIRFKDTADYVIGMEVFSPMTPEEIAAEAAAKAAAVAAGEIVEPDGPEESEEIDDGEAPEGGEASNEPIPPYSGVILTSTEKGFGKRTTVNAYRVTHRGGRGVINLVTRGKTGDVLAIKRMFEGDELMLVTNSGKLIRIDSGKVRETGRAASGVKLISLDDKDRVSSVVRIPAKEETAD